MANSSFTFPIVFAAILALLPYLISAFALQVSRVAIRRLPARVRICFPSLFCLPYLLVSLSTERFRWGWLLLYAFLPVAMAWLMERARSTDPEQRVHWREWCLLIPLGLSVDLRWFEAAWPAHLGVFNKVLLLDGGIYAILLIRELEGVGFDLRLRLHDLRIGLREFLFYSPIAILLGLSLGFLHWHANWPAPSRVGEALFFTFFFIAVPEELFFRGWIQNLLAKRLPRVPALMATSAVFGLSHWNKRTTGFNWQYVLMAALAGVFYGRAWLQDGNQERRVGAASVTHTLVDTVWSLWLR